MAITTSSLLAYSSASCSHIGASCLQCPHQGASAHYTTLHNWTTFTNAVGSVGNRITLITRLLSTIYSQDIISYDTSIRRRLSKLCSYRWSDCYCETSAFIMHLSHMQIIKFFYIYKIFLYLSCISGRI